PSAPGADAGRDGDGHEPRVQRIPVRRPRAPPGPGARPLPRRWRAAVDGGLPSPASPRSGDDHPRPPGARGGAVAAITEAAIRELAARRGRSAPITSCYLDVDGRRLVRKQDLEREVEQALRTLRAKAGGDPSVEKDAERIDRYIRTELDRSRVRGVAIFACSADDLWEVVELPVRVRTRVTVNQAPAVGQLEALLQD